MKTIIEMAQEAGLGWAEGLGGIPEFLESFADLVREEVYKSDDMTTAYMAGFSEGSHGLKDKIFNAIIDSESLYQTLSLRQIELMKTIIKDEK